MKTLQCETTVSNEVIFCFFVFKDYVDCGIPSKRIWYFCNTTKTIFVTFKKRFVHYDERLD